MSEKITIIDVFYTDDPVIDKWTWVLNETNPYNHSYNAMIATDNTGRGFSQMCEGLYEPGGDNAHLGYRPRLVGESLVNHVMGRLTDPEADNNYGL